MSKQKTPSLPSTPTFQTDPFYNSTQSQLSGLGGRLTNFDFSGGLSPLQDTINLDPEVTKLALQYAQGTLTPAFNLQRQNTTNDLANLGALESSTTSNAFAQEDTNLNSQYQAIVAGAALDDRSRALQNRLNLFGTGLNTLQGVAGFGLQNQGQQNQFNLSNYENQVAATLATQKQQSGGLFGGLTGALGGGLAGFTLGGPIGAGIGALGGGLLGGLSPQSSNTGGSLLGAGAGIYGSHQVGQGLQGLFSQTSKTNTTLPGMFASNSLRF